MERVAISNYSVVDNFRKLIAGIAALFFEYYKIPNDGSDFFGSNKI
jgi:hypothetical protein